jgi:hypothetical protein
MMHFIVMSTLMLLPSLALAKQPADRRIFPPEITAEDGPPLRESRLTLPRFELLRLRNPNVWRWSRLVIDSQTPIR